MWFGHAVDDMKQHLLITCPLHIYHSPIPIGHPIPKLMCLLLKSFY